MNTYRKDCFYFSEVIDFGGHIPFCCSTAKLEDSPCRDCKNYISKSDAYQVVRKHQNAPTVGWTSVKERLPEEDGEYLVVLGRLNDKWGPSVDLRHFAKDMRKCFSVSEKFKRRPGWYFHDGEWGDVEDTTVEFWMLKPEPSEVEE